MTESEEYHIVRRGDNLFQISKATGIAVKKLKLYNNLIDDEIFLGQKIYLKPNLVVFPKYITRVEIPPEKFHIVGSGQSLVDISHKYGVFILDLVDFNGLSSVDVRQGQKIWLVEGKQQSKVPKVNLATKKASVSRPKRKQAKSVATTKKVQKSGESSQCGDKRGWDDNSCYEHKTQRYRSHQGEESYHENDFPGATATLWTEVSGGWR